MAKIENARWDYVKQCDEEWKQKNKRSPLGFGHKPSGAARSKRQAAKRRNIAKRMGK